MITCRWSIACEHAVVDRYTNNVSLLHIIDQITVRVPPEPASPIPISLDVMTLWERGDAESPESGESRTVIVTPQGEEVSHTATHELTSPSTSACVRGSESSGCPSTGMANTSSAST